MSSSLVPMCSVFDCDVIGRCLISSCATIFRRSFEMFMRRYGEIVRYCPPSQLPGARSIGRDMLRQLYIRLSSCAVFARMGSIRYLYKEGPRWSPSLILHILPSSTPIGGCSLRQTLVKSDPDVVLLDLIKHLISIGVSISLSVIDWDNACIQREDEVYRGHD